MTKGVLTIDAEKTVFEAAELMTQKEVGDVVVLKGEIPSPANPPSGCVFHPRCRYAQDICKQEIPTLVEIKPEHYASCHFADTLDLKGTEKNP